MEVNKSSIMADVELQNYVNPYDDLLSMIMDDSTTAEVPDFSRLSPIDFPLTSLTNETQGRFQSKAEESDQPEVEPRALSPSSDLIGSDRLDEQLHKPLTMESLPMAWGEQSETLIEQRCESESPPSMTAMGFELFIEEEDEDIEDKEEDIKGFNERLGPQVEHGVSCFC